MDKKHSGAVLHCMYWGDSCASNSLYFSRSLPDLICQICLHYVLQVEGQINYFRLQHIYVYLLHMIIACVISPTDLPAGLSHSPTTGVVVPYSSAALPTGTFPHAGSSSSLKESATTQVTFAHARTRTLSCGLEESASDSMRYMQSLPTMEGPVTFVAPELAEEVLMDVSGLLV